MNDQNGTEKVKRIIQRLLLAVAVILVSPLILMSKLSSLFGSNEFFTTGGCLLALLPGRFGSIMRLAYYRATLESVSYNVAIGFGSYFSRRDVVLGRNVSIGAYCILGDVTLNDRVLLASRVSIPSGKRQHSMRYDNDNPSDETIFDHVTIGCDSWIGEGAIIMADIGERCIVSAGSVVTRAMPSNRVIAGNPARVLPETSASTSNSKL